MELAAQRGDLEALQWIRAHGGDWDERTCSGAAGAGDLAVLQWARANGCPWDEETCSKAVAGGHLVVLQWARANCCAWGRLECFKIAIEALSQCLDAQRNIIANEDLVYVNIERIGVARAALDSRNEMLTWVREQAD